MKTPRSRPAIFIPKSGESRPLKYLNPHKINAYSHIHLWSVSLLPLHTTSTFRRRVRLRTSDPVRWEFRSAIVQDTQTRAVKAIKLCVSIMRVGRGPKWRCDDCFVVFQF